MIKRGMDLDGMNDATRSTPEYDWGGSPAVAASTGIQTGGDPLQTVPIPIIAYIGDAIYELYARLQSVKTTAWRMKDIHRSAVGLVKADSQAEFLRRLDPMLSEKEKEVVRRGRNAKSGQIPRGVSASSYRHSTALETLIGYLYLCGNRERLDELFTYLGSVDE